MKKTTLNILSASAFAIALLLCFIQKTNGKVNVIKQADASVQRYNLVVDICPDHINFYSYCNSGSDSICNSISCPLP